MRNCFCVCCLLVVFFLFFVCVLVCVFLLFVVACFCMFGLCRCFLCLRWSDRVVFAVVLCMCLLFFVCCVRCDVVECVLFVVCFPLIFKNVNCAFVFV